MPDINGTNGNDIITESSGFSGGTPGAGDDTITGLGGDDVIAGGDGSDLLIGDARFPIYVSAATTVLAGIDVGFRSTPSFTDLDGDGDLDLVVGAFDGTLRTYQRNQDEGVVSFTELTGSDNLFGGIDVGYFSAPSFTDLDGDGDLDLVLGGFDGTLRAYRRNEVEGVVSFTELADNPFGGIDVHDLSAPSFTDLDGDGDLDLVLGGVFGTLRAYLRNEVEGVVSFTELADNPFFETYLGFEPKPSFTDLDGDGDLDLVVGEEGDRLRAYQRNEVEGVVSFTELTGSANPFGGIDVGYFSAPSFTDLDGDGRLEAVIGNYDGNLQVFTLVAGNDSLSGGAGADTLLGQLGDDALSGGAGNDELNGGDGFDWASYAELTATQAITVNLVTGRATGAAGSDTLIGIENLLGGAGNDSLLGDDVANLLSGGAGIDRLRGGEGNDTLDGGEGADIMSGGNGDDLFIVGEGDVFSSALGQGTDTILLRRAAVNLLNRSVENVTGDMAGQAFSITGNTRTNVLVGGDLADTLDGGSNHDTLAGGAGNDSLIGDAGNDCLVGGDGLDWASYAELTATQAITANLVTGRATGAAGSDTLIGIENLLGGAGNDSLMGDDIANLLSGGAGIDRLRGGEGHDTLDGGEGADTMWGGNGDDVFVVDDAGDRVLENSGHGTDTVLLRMASFSLGGINAEHVTGDAGGLAFSITGNSLANQLTGGGLGDTLRGSSGDDTLIGLDGDDKLGGGSDDDVLEGGLGADTLIGGSGNNSFVFNTALGSGNVDRIQGYVVDDDFILLDDAIFTALGSPGRLAAGAFNTGTAATDADDRIIYNADTGVLLYDADGVGGVAAMQFATLTGVSGFITNTEFLIFTGFLID